MLWTKEIHLKIGVTLIDENMRRVAWDDLIMCKAEQLTHQWERVIWYKLSERKEGEEDLKCSENNISRNSKIWCVN